MADEKIFLSVPEAAEVLGITRIAVFKKVQKNQIEAIRIGRNWAIPVSALKVAAPKKPAPSPAAVFLPSASKKTKFPPPAVPAAAPVFGDKNGILEDMGWD